MSSTVAIIAVLAWLSPEPNPQPQDLGLGKMWTFEQPPLDYLHREHGFTPSREWLQALRLSSLVVDDEHSGSFVSPHGLILTNHHCLRDHLARAQGDRDWVHDGYSATEPGDEIALPGLTVRQLVGIRDVTAEMNAGVDPDLDAMQRGRQRQENRQRLLEAAGKEFPDLRPQVVTLFQGVRDQLYLYRVWDDIRLVCVPHQRLAHFGGDYDNFTYPRHALDFGFVRAYEDGHPAATAEHYFRWNTTGLQAGETVFVTGCPGRTQRTLTYAQLRFLRDVYHPLVIEMIDHRLALLRGVARTPDLEDRLRGEIGSFESAKKSFDGYLRGLRDADLMSRKLAAERALRDAVASRPDWQEEFGTAWDRLDDIADGQARLEAARRFQNHGGHPVLRLATLVVLAADPERSPEERARCAESARSDRERILRRGIDEVTRLGFLDHVERARNWLPDDDPWIRIMTADRSASELADLLCSSPLLEEARLESLLVADAADRDPADRDPAGRDPADSDPADRDPRDQDLPELAIARVVTPLMEANAAQHRRLEEAEAVEQRRIARALHAVYGDGVSPTCTASPRFSDGVVAGYEYNGTLASYRTTLHGLFARHVEFDGRPPFDLPAIWLEAESRLDLGTTLNVVSTNDIAPGNSGSPLVNAGLELVGLVFDGNIEMLPNRYLYRSERARAVSVHVDGILAAVRDVYRNQRLTAELIGR